MNQKSFWAFFLIMLSVSIGITIVNLNEPLRDSVRDFLLRDQRQILAKAIGDLSGLNETFTVLKVKTKDSLSIEIYQNSENESTFRGRFILPEKRDGHFTYQGNATNLILMDINADSSLEILTSSYDENLVPRMHVLRFHNDRADFEELGPENLPL